jgi:sporulation protein YlmC with PRC-barrel domain
MSEDGATGGEAAVVPVGELTGLTIFDRSGARLGSVKEVFASKVTGRIEFVLGATGGLLGVGEKYHPIPWSTLTYHAAPEGYVASFDKAELRDAPAYDRSQLANPAYGWADQVRRYFAMRTSA